MARPGVAEALRDLAAVLAGWGDRWYLFGAQAVVVWGRPRLTADLDVTVALAPEDPRGFARAMEGAGFPLRVKDADGFVARTRVLPFLHAASGLPVDVVLSGPGLEEEFHRRAVRVDVGGVVAPVISPEDLVVTKILASRPKDLEDARGVIQQRGEALDVAYVRATLRLLEQALDQADLVPALDALLS